MKTIDDLKVHDSVHYYNNCNDKTGRIYTGVVVKVGSKLITIINELNDTISFRKDTYRTNDNYGHQTLISDIEEFNTRKIAETIRTAILRQLERRTEVTNEQINKIAEILKIQ